METSPKRPIVVWIALAYIAIGLITNLLFLYARADQRLLFRPELSNIAFLLLNLVTIGLLIITYDAVVRRKPTGQRLAILSFSLVGIFGIYNTLVLFQSEVTFFSNYPVITQIIIFGRIALSFYLAIAFAVSRTIDRYFAEVEEPPPPPSFD